MAKTNTLAVIGLICAFIFPLIGLILSIIALSQIKKDPTQDGKGLAIAGIIISALFFLVLIPIVLIAASAYFGVLNPQTLIPSACTLHAGMACTDYSATKDDGGKISLQLMNGQGMGIIITGVTATPVEGSVIKNPCAAYVTGSSNGAPSSIIQLNNGERGDIVLACPPGTFSTTKSGTIYKWDITINYYNEDSSPDYTKLMQGELRTTIG